MIINDVMTYYIFQRFLKHNTMSRVIEMMVKILKEAHNGIAVPATSRAHPRIPARPRNEATTLHL